MKKYSSLLMPLSSEFNVNVTFCFLWFLFFAFSIDLSGQTLINKYLPIPLEGFSNPSIVLKKNNAYLICSALNQYSIRYSFLSEFDITSDSSDVVAITGPINHHLLMTMAYETSDNGLLIGGGFDTIFNNTTPRFNTFLLKMDSLNNIQWSKIIYHNSSSTGVVSNFSKLGNSGYLINKKIRTDSLGNIIWNKINSIMRGITLPASNGNLITAGGNTISETDSTLNGIWSKTYSTISIYSGIKTNSNEFAFCGLIDSLSYHGIFFLKIDTAGTPLIFKCTDYSTWTNQIHILQLPDNSFGMLCARNNHNYILHIDSTGSFKFLGYFTPPSGQLYPGELEPHNDSVFTAVLNYTSNFYNSVNPILIDVSINDSTRCGFVQDSISWRQDTINYTNNSVYNSYLSTDSMVDYHFNTFFWRRGVWDYCNPSTYLTELNDQTHIDLYPNPAINEITFSSEEVIINAEITIYDQLGRIKLKKEYKEFQSDKLEIDYPPMVYFLTIRSTNLFFTKMFVIGQ